MGRNGWRCCTASWQYHVIKHCLNSWTSGAIITKISHLDEENKSKATKISTSHSIQVWGCFPLTKAAVTHWCSGGGIIPACTPSGHILPIKSTLLLSFHILRTVTVTQYFCNLWSITVHNRTWLQSTSQPTTQKTLSSPAATSHPLTFREKFPLCTCLQDASYQWVRGYCWATLFPCSDFHTYVGWRGATDSAKGAPSVHGRKARGAFSSHF